MEKFTPSPTRIVRVINAQGILIKELKLNRKDRRKLGIKSRR